MSSPHVTERVVLRNHTRGEIAMGIFWLSLGAIVSVLLETVYLGTWVGGVAVPFTVLIAWWFNSVLTKTALLWSPKPYVALFPLFVWLLGFFLLLGTSAFSGDQLIGNNARSMLLMAAGIIGGIWPIVRRR